MTTLIILAVSLVVSVVVFRAVMWVGDLWILGAEVLDDTPQ